MTPHAREISADMLKSYTVARYRSFQDPTTVELRPLTLLFGYNNAGKSALLRALPLIASSLESNGPSPLNLKSSPAARGCTFDDLRCRLVSTPGIEMSLAWGIDSRYEVTVRDLPELRRQVVSQLTIERAKVRFSAHWLPESEAKKIGSLYEFDSGSKVVGLSFGGLKALTTDASHPNAPLLAAAAKDLDALARNIHWLGSMRALPERSYTPAGFAPERLGDAGQGFADVLLYDSLEGGNLLERVSSWFERQFSARVRLDDRGDDFFFTLDPVERPGLGIHFADTGEGVAQVLPVLVALEMARAAEGRVLALEQPELHLHPAAEIALGERLVELAARDRGPSLLVETHSEHLMLAVQLSIARGALSPGAVLAYWVEKLEDGRSHLRRLEFSDDGRVLGGWPRGVFSEDTEQARELYLLRRERAAS